MGHTWVTHGSHMGHMGHTWVTHGSNMCHIWVTHGSYGSHGVHTWFTNVLCSVRTMMHLAKKYNVNPLIITMLHLAVMLRPISTLFLNFHNLA